jgi:hypothetical protein
MRPSRSRRRMREVANRTRQQREQEAFARGQHDRLGDVTAHHDWVAHSRASLIESKIRWCQGEPTINAS